MEVALAPDKLYSPRRNSRITLQDCAFDSYEQIRNHQDKRNMPGKLTNRIALITGANRGIGLAVAKAYAKEGAKLLLAGRRADALREVQSDIAAAGGDARVLTVQLEDPDSVRALAEQVATAVPQLDIFVANAASLGARVPLIRYPLDDWTRTFKINVDANLILLGALDPLLKKSDSARIIMLSAGVARQGKATTGSYAVSKAALEAMVRIYAVEAAGTPVRINVVNPGPTRTQMRARAAPDENPMILKTPEDIAPLFVELASKECQRQGDVINADEWFVQASKP
jgi:NAD(P)-dependent dehydrogenase (short-subunit alcohol dehydrogenase family)